MPTNIHDKFFKTLLSDDSNAKFFLKIFLPKPINEKIDYKTLKLVNKSFISEELKETFADMIFECKMGSNEKSNYISILLEHKSQPYKYTELQVMGYIISAYNAQVKAGKPLKFILPVVFYHGGQNWKMKSLNELIEGISKDFLDYIPKLKIVFIDLGKFSDKQLIDIGNTFMSSALLTQKYSHNPQELINKIDLIFGNLFPDANRNLIGSFFVYFIKIVELPEKEFIELIEKISPPIKNEIMSTYEMIAEKYKKQGIEQGIEKNVLRMYKKQFDISQIADILDISEEKVRDILSKHDLI